MKSAKTGLTRAINWNVIEDEKDLEIWNKLIKNFWVPEKIAVSNDVQSWGNLTDAEKELVLKAFTGLTLLDTIQGTVGAINLIPDALTPHEEAVYTNIAFMESVHAKSYSFIFSTLCSTEKINEAFRWSEENEYLQKKASIIEGFYRGDDPYRKKIASTLLESFLFYSGFYLPFKMASNQRLVNSATVISLILRDEALHGFYIGYKYQKSIAHLSDEKKQELKDDTYELLEELFENEIRYTQELYDGVGWTADVKAFLRYNANKALNNLGYDNLFDEADCQFDPAVRVAMSGGSDDHDFFSTTSSSYVLPTSGKVMTDEDYEDMWDDEDED